MKKSSLYPKNIYLNRYLGKIKSCKKRSYYYLIYLVINQITLSIVLTIKISSATIKKNTTSS